MARQIGRADLPAWVEPGTQGFVFATTGLQYTILAQRAARTVKQAMPDAQVDLFTDQEIDDDLFGQVHQLRHDWFRPKMQALRESRFERTVYLDADMIVLADISEVFDVLKEYDITGVQAKFRNRQMVRPGSKVPRAFPPVNSGLLGMRASDKTVAFAQTWEDAVRNSVSPVDQPALRRLIYRSDLRFAALGIEYNLLWLDMLEAWSTESGAPRVLHVTSLHEKDPGDPNEPFSLREAIGNRRAKHVQALLDADWSLGGNPAISIDAPVGDMRIVEYLAGSFVPTGLIRRIRDAVRHKQNSKAAEIAPPKKPTLP